MLHWTYITENLAKFNTGYLPVPGKMYKHSTHMIEDCIVSLHQPHVRPIVRDKSHDSVEFSPKIHVSLVDGISFLDELCWDAFNEGSWMESYIENYRKRFGFYSEEVLADRIYSL
jgi:hypothetical protein